MAIRETGVAMRLTARVALGICAAGLVSWPTAVGAQDSEPDPEAITDAVAFYTSELYSVDFDGDGVADITDANNDGVPEIPEGEPGDRDITPDNPRFGAQITDQLAAIGFDNVVSISDSSTLVGDCGGMAMSFDDSGKMIDMAIGIPSNEGGGPNGQVIDVMPGASSYGQRAFTSGNPFEVNVKGKVVYVGTLPRNGDGPREHNWEIKTAGISLDKGGDPNQKLRNRNAGVVDLGKEIGSVLLFTGDFDMEAWLTSTNGLSCNASGHIRFVGPFPLFTAVGAFATVLGGLGIIGLLFNSRPAITWKAGG